MGSLHSHAQSMRRSGRAVDNGQRRCVEELLDVAQGCGAGAKGRGARRTLFGGCGGRNHPLGQTPIAPCLWWPCFVRARVQMEQICM